MRQRGSCVMLGPQIRMNSIVFVGAVHAAEKTTMSRLLGIAVSLSYD